MSRGRSGVYAASMLDRFSALRVVPRRGAALAAIAFAIGAAFFLGYVPGVGWGAPGTAAYTDYETANRIMLVPLLVHLAGWALELRSSARGAALAGTIGATMFVLGNVGEFWLFSAEPYSSAARLLSWSTFLLGALVSLSAFAFLAMSSSRRATV
jgi:hypothetical protein